MSLVSVPVEIITHIFDLLDESEQEKPFEIHRHREMCKALMALRLTCKELEGITTGQLFRTLSLSSSWDSWSKLHTVAANQKFRVHLQTLALDMSQCWKTKHTLMKGNAFESPKFRFLDFSLFPNLKVLKVEDSWIITKKPRSKAQIPLGRFGIHPESFCADTPVAWRLISGLEDIARYDFRLSSVNYALYVNSLPSSLRGDFSGLVYLSLFFVGGYITPTNLDHGLDLLERLMYLPNLEEFHLDQYFHDQSNQHWILDNTPNVLKKLAKGNFWPRLRHLILRYLVTTVEDLKAFVAPHTAGDTLETFEMHGYPICTQVTAEEILQRGHLKGWIRNVICPQGEGERESFI